MDNPRISENTREMIEEAAVAVFMDQYAAALDAAIDNKIDESADMAFPPELDKRCRALIQQEYAKQHKKKRANNALRVFRSAAIVAMVLLSLCSVLFVSVEAFRLPIMNFFIEKTDRYWQLSDAPDANSIRDAFNPENPMDGIIPDDFFMTALIGSWEGDFMTAEYSNGDKVTISFIMIPSDGKTQIDTEESSVVPHKVLAHDALKAVEGDCVRITWLDEENNKIFTLDATNVVPEMVEVYAETVAARLS